MSATATEPMPRKTGKTPTDYIVRLPPEYREFANAIRAVTGRPATICVQIAIEQAAIDHGIDIKPNWPHLLRRRDDD